MRELADTADKWSKCRISGECKNCGAGSAGFRRILADSDGIRQQLDAGTTAPMHMMGVYAPVRICPAYVGSGSIATFTSRLNASSRRGRRGVAMLIQLQVPLMRTYYACRGNL